MLLVFLILLNTICSLSLHSSMKDMELPTNRQDTLKRPVNPVIPGDFADPTIMRVGNKYYASATSSEWAPYFPIFTSKDLVNWKQEGYIFTKKPDWAQSSFWAPEFFSRNGKYYLYYTARRKSDGISCIGVAVSDHPSRGYKDQGIVLEFGKEAIDSFIIEDQGKLYITWKAYGLDKRPIEILGCLLSADGLKAIGEPFTLLKDDNKIMMEGQCLVKRNGFYYLFYSSGSCCGIRCSYHVRVARARSLSGPYENYKDPVLTADNDWKCTGHGTVVQDKQHNYFYLYHAFSTKDHVFTGRQGMMKRLLWNDVTNWPYFMALEGLQPVQAADLHSGFYDGFDKKAIGLAWQWDLKFADPVVSFKKGRLLLAGKANPLNTIGNAITVRPFKGAYTASTRIENYNGALKGLVVYGDVNNAVGLGVVKDTLQLWQIKKGKREVLKKKQIMRGALDLKIVAADNYKYTFYYKTAEENWTALSLENSSFYNGSFLPPWDRSPRPGLMHKGAEDESAIFSSFTIAY